LSHFRARTLYELIGQSQDSISSLGREMGFILGLPDKLEAADST
jgi:hypothetical protein